MNKLLKGSIAGAVGVALLLGGAGTFASWNSSGSITSAVIKAGTLTVSDSGIGGTWRNLSAATGTPTISPISAFRIVPGDSISYTKTMNIAATGDNLTATLSLDPTAITPVTPGTLALPSADDKLASFLTGTAVVTASGSGITAITPVVGTPTFKIAPTTIGVTSTVTVVVTLKFASGAAGAENAAMAGSVDLSKMAVLLTQN